MIRLKIIDDMRARVRRRWWWLDRVNSEQVHPLKKLCLGRGPQRGYFFERSPWTAIFCNFCMRDLSRVLTRGFRGHGWIARRKSLAVRHTFQNNLEFTVSKSYKFSKPPTPPFLNKLITWKLWVPSVWNVCRIPPPFNFRRAIHPLRIPFGKKYILRDPFPHTKFL